MTSIYHFFKTTGEEEYITFMLNGGEKYYPGSKEFETYKYRRARVNKIMDRLNNTNNYGLAD